MNISQPVLSSVRRVEFSFLSKDEIHAISCRAIQNDSTFDTLLNSVRGGLYDPALGSWGDTMYAPFPLTLFTLLTLDLSCLVCGGRRRLFPAQH